MCEKSPLCDLKSNDLKTFITMSSDGMWQTRYDNDQIFRKCVILLASDKFPNAIAISIAIAILARNIQASMIRDAYEYTSERIDQMCSAPDYNCVKRCDFEYLRYE